MSTQEAALQGKEQMVYSVEDGRLTLPHLTPNPPGAPPRPIPPPLTFDQFHSLAAQLGTQPKKAANGVLVLFFPRGGGFMTTRGVDLQERASIVYEDPAWLVFNLGNLESFFVKEDPNVKKPC